MVYTPVLTVHLTQGKLVQSDDLTVPLSSFFSKTVYLIVERNQARIALDLSQILLFESDLNISSPISSAFTSRLNDNFVTRYRDDSIPLLNDRGFYTNRLKVFNPTAYKDHTVKFTSINTPQIVDDVSKKGFLDDLVIDTRSDIANYLVAVNGVFHKTVIHQDKLYVLDGFRTMRLTDRDDITIVDTSPIGGHTILPMTSNNVTQTVYNGLATVTSPTSLKGKSIFLVIDGYFYHQDTKAFHFVNDKTISIHTHKLPLLDQFRHNPRTMYKLDRYGADASQSSRKYEDAYDALFLNHRQIPASQFTTRNFQYSRLTNYHSFIVVMNNPTLFTIDYEIQPTGTPQFYRDHADRMLSGMMSYSVGACPSYLILRDPYRRKSVYIEKQNYDLNIHKESITPIAIPSLIPEMDESVSLPVRLIDYVSA